MVGFIAGRTAPPGSPHGPRGCDHLRRQGWRRGQDRRDGGCGHPRLAVAGGSWAKPCFAGAEAAREARRYLGVRAVRARLLHSEVRGRSPRKATETWRTTGPDQRRARRRPRSSTGATRPSCEDLYAQWAAEPGSVDAVLAAPSSPQLLRRPGDAARAAGQARLDQTGDPGRHAPTGWPRRRRPVARGRSQGRAKASPEGQPAASTDATSAPPPSTGLRAIMMIRAYRMRGHLKANLDPLGIAATQGDASELDPATYGFTEADLRPSDLPRLRAGPGDRPRIREILADPRAHLLRQRRRAVHAHLRSEGEGLAAGAHRGPRTRRSPSPRRARSPS